MNLINPSFFRTVVIVVVFILFFSSSLVFLDPDFGWHLTMGNLILTEGIPKTDPFSYTMSSFHFIDHEWLTNVILSKAYPIIGQIGLSFLYTAMAISALFIGILNCISKRNFIEKLKSLHLYYLPFILGIASIFVFFGIRPQVESWLLFAIWLYVILNDSIWKKWMWALPLFIILWTNLHGSFATAIVSLSIIVILKSIRLRKVWFEGVIFLFLGIIATFVNPYGPGIWKEVWLQMSDTRLRWTIAEWKPAVFYVNFAFLTLATTSVVIIYRYRKKFRLELLGLNIFFLLQAIGSVRHIPLWVLVNLPMFTISLGYFYQSVKKIEFGKKRFKKVYMYAVLGSLFLFIFQSTTHLLTVSRYFNEKYFYPKEAISFLKSDIPKGEMFSEYGWGGYLIWKLPEKKVFIDGRMPSWRWNANLANESNYAMNDYIDILKGKLDYKNVFEKYNIDTVLWPVSKPGKLADRISGKFSDFLTKFGYKKSDFNFIEKLEEDGWEQVYKDSVAMIYKNTNN